VERDPADVDYGFEPIAEAPFASSACRQLALLYRVRFGDAATRALNIVGPLLAGLIGVLCTVVEPALGVAWIALVALCYLVMSVGVVLAWWSSGGAGNSLSIRGGGLDIRTSSALVWYPAEQLTRWGVGGGSLEIRISDGSFGFADMAELRSVSRAGIDQRFRAPSEAPEPGAVALIASFPNPLAARRALSRAMRELEPGVRRQAAVWWAVVVVEIGAFVVICAFAASILREGWEGTLDSSVADLVLTLLVTIGMVAAVLVAGTVVGRLRLAARPVVSTRVWWDGATIWFVQDDGLVIRFPLSSITRARVDHDQVVFVTCRPYSGARIPVSSLVDGGRELITEALTPVLV